MTPSSPQRVAAIDHAGTFPFDGRGPILHRWLWFEDLLLPDSSAGFQTLPKSRVGAQSENGWVVFHGVQVVQSVPEEVHSYWHYDLAKVRGAAWHVESSTWLASFDPRHLADCQHYIVEFYDHVIEVICEELIFGTGTFNITEMLPDEPRLRYAYMRRAIALKKMGRFEEARADFDRYIATSPDEASLRSAELYRRSLFARLTLTEMLEDASLSLDARVTSITDLLRTLDWEALRSGLLQLLYDDSRQSAWRPCLEAHLRLLSAERKTVSDCNLMALAVHRLGDEDECVTRFAARLEFNMDPVTDPRLVRELARLRKRAR